MKVFVIGATGMTGSAFVQETVANGLEIIANGRSEEKLAQLKSQFPQIQISAKDAFQLTPADFSDSDVVLDAFATTPDKAYRHIDLATKLVSQFRESQKVRLGFILGAGSLLIGDDDHVALTDLEKDESTRSWRAIPQEQFKELKFLRDVDNVDWFGVSPAFSYTPGPKAKEILYDSEHVIFNHSGESKTTAGTMAAALVSEILTPKHHQQRFTVANG